MEKIITFTPKKETKGTVAYEEQAADDMPVIGSLYVKKYALAGARPAKITVTVQW